MPNDCTVSTKPLPWLKAEGLKDPPRVNLMGDPVDSGRQMALQKAGEVAVIQTLGWAELGAASAFASLATDAFFVVSSAYLIVKSMVTAPAEGWTWKIRSTVSCSITGRASGGAVRAASWPRLLPVRTLLCRALSGS